MSVNTTILSIINLISGHEKIFVISSFNAVVAYGDDRAEFCDSAWKSRELQIR